MPWRTKILAVAVLAILVGMGYSALAIVRNGFSAREEPTRLETFLARHVWRIAIPVGTKQMKNPYPPDAPGSEATLKRWVEHCGLCHAHEGSGQTAIGRNLYPKPPDLRQSSVQELTDGELYYIIRNGIRFTGMPAWDGKEDSDAIWQLITLIRKLPNLFPMESKDGNSEGKK